MNVLKELFELHLKSSEIESFLLLADKELLEYAETHLHPSEETVFWSILNTTLKTHEEYFFKLGFETAKNLIVK